MVRGGKILLLGTSLAAAGCGADHNVQVRAIPQPGAKFNYGGSLMAQARTELALGSVGLALESFRKLQLEQPENPAVYAGIAACYAVMGRYDIARQNYEFALAYAPNDPALLSALASSLDRLGDADQAAQIRIEATRLSAAPVTSLAQAAATPLSVPRLSSVTVKLPAPLPVAAAAAHTEIPRTAAVATVEKAPEPPIGAPDLSPGEVRLSSTPLAPIWTKLAADAPPVIAASEPPVEPVIEAPQRLTHAVQLAAAPFSPKAPAMPTMPRLEMAIPEPAAPAIAAPDLTAPSVKLASLPRTPAKSRVVAEPVFLSLINDDVQPTVAATSAVRPREPAVVLADAKTDTGPYLERLSSGEVSLVTSPAPQRVAHSKPRIPEAPLPGRTDIAMNVPVQPVQRFASATGVRWMPLKYAPARTTIQLLNAARTESLAARTRTALLDRGWHKIRIGNAQKIRQHSLVLYASARWAVARRLAAHFGCKAVKSDRVQNVVVLLGRDVALPRRGSERA